MSDNTGIEWADATWNVVLGCDRVSPGCDHCYAIGNARIRESHPNPKVSGPYAGLVEERDGRIDWTGQVNLVRARLWTPLHWSRPRRIFVNAQSDLFHDEIPPRFIADVFAVMAATSRHTYQILTKRPARMRSLLTSTNFEGMVREFYRNLPAAERANQEFTWPLPNVWMGVSVEDQKRADLRIPTLLDTPAAVRFISAEPLLGPVDLVPPLKAWARDNAVKINDHLHWVIVGGESGPGARPMHPDWARQLRDQCKDADVAFLFKQWGNWRPHTDGGVQLGDLCMSLDGDTYTVDKDYICAHNESDGTWLRRMEKKLAGRVLDGRTWDGYPGVDHPGSGCGAVTYDPQVG